MTKLYHHDGSWQIPGQQDRKAARVDVPTPPAALAAWLNSRHVPLAGDVFDGIVPCNEPARELLEAMRGAAAGEAKPWILGEPTKEPPRYLPKHHGDFGNVDFVPVTKLAELDLHLQRCPMCHNTEAAAAERRDRLDFDGIMAWIRDRATRLELDDLADLIEEKRK